MSESIVLRVVGSYGELGRQDGEGVERFNSRVDTKFGRLGKLKSHAVKRELVIDQADDVVLIKRGLTGPHLTSWVNPFGGHIFQVTGRNGVVRYQLRDEPVEWERTEADDRREQLGLQNDKASIENMQIGLLIYSAWQPEGPPPPETRNTVITKHFGEMYL